MKHVYAVIMAGGGGTRLWPISRKKHPKHMLPLLGERTLFQSALDRLEGFIPAEQIIVVTTEEQADELKKQGFGILTEIDVRETLKKKLYVNFQKYKILGACNSPFAYEALQVENKSDV